MPQAPSGARIRTCLAFPTDEEHRQQSERTEQQQQSGGRRGSGGNDHDHHRDPSFARWSVAEWIVKSWREHGYASQPPTWRRMTGSVPGLVVRKKTMTQAMP